MTSHYGRIPSWRTWGHLGYTFHTEITKRFDNHVVNIYIYIESLMSCHLLLNLLHEWANMILFEGLPSIISFLPTHVINLVINDNEFEILFIT